VNAIDGPQALRDYTVESYQSFVCLQHSFGFMTTNHSLLQVHSTLDVRWLVTFLTHT